MYIHVQVEQLKIANYWSWLISIHDYQYIVLGYQPPVQFRKGQSGKQYYQNIIEI